MKRIIYLLIAATLIACAPGKKSEPMFVDVYCDSCHITVENMWYESPGANKPRVSEYPFDGNVSGYKRIEVYRFDSPNSCVRVINYVNYDTTDVDIYYIENNDTLAHAVGANGYCY